MPAPVAQDDPDEFEKTFGMEAQKAVEEGFDLFDVRFSAQLSALDSRDPDAWHTVGMALYQWSICGRGESVPKSLRESFPDGKLGSVPVLYVLLHAGWLGNETSRAVLWHAYGMLHGKDGVALLPAASAADLFQQAYFGEEPDAQYELGQRYENGPPNLQPLALFWWSEAARNGNPDGQSRVGRILAELENPRLEGSEELAPLDEWNKLHPTPEAVAIEHRLDKARKALRDAEGDEFGLMLQAQAEGKGSEAERQLAKLRESRSDEDERQIAKAREEYRNALVEQMNVGKDRSRLKRANRKRLHAEGWKWIEQAAAQGNPEALFALGAKLIAPHIDYEYGKNQADEEEIYTQVSNYAGEPYDSEEAVNDVLRGIDHVRQAVARAVGRQRAEYALELAKLLSWNLASLKGRRLWPAFFRWSVHGLPRLDAFDQLERVRRAVYDPKQALRWYRYAGTHGDLPVLRDLSDSIGSGSKEMIESWRVKHQIDNSLHTDPDDILFLPIYYDPREAARWVRAAALNGHVVAQMELGQLYADGEGVPKDNVSMYAWWSVAASGALDELERWSYGEGMEWIREQLKADFHLSSAEVAQGQALARELFAQMSRNSRADASPDTPRQGSGILFGDGAVTVTNHHVVAGCSRVDVVRDGQERSAAVAGVDGGNDLVLLELDRTLRGGGAYLRLRPKVSVGERAVVAGFPFTSGDGFTVTTGNISATRGPAGRTGLFQFTAPIQQGNSGGPVIGDDGAILGVVVSKLDAIAVAAATGDLPQNVNYAVHGAVLRTFLDLNGVDYRALARSGQRSDAELADEARRFTVLVTCTSDTQPSGTDP